MEALEQRLVLSGVNVEDGQTFGQSDVIAAQQVDTYSQSTGGTLQIELGGTVAGTGFDQVNVTGAASLAGTVEVKLINGFMPEEGDTFDFLTFGSNAGSFDLATGLFGFGDGEMYFEVLEQSDRLQLVARELPGLREMGFSHDDEASQLGDALGMLFNANYFGFDTFTITAAVGLGDFFGASGTLTLQNSNETVTLADGTSVTADVVRIGGKDLKGFAGTSGPYFVDSDEDGDIDGDDTPNAEATGLALEDVDFGLALIEPTAGQSKVAGLEWTALKATAGGAAFVGSDDITLAANNVTVAFNQVSGVSSLMFRQSL